MRVLLIMGMLLTANLYIAQQKTRKVRLSRAEQTATVCLEVNDYFISISRASLRKKLEELNIQGIDQFAIRDTVDLASFRQSIFEQTKNSTFDEYLLRTMKRGKAKVFSVKDTSFLPQILIRHDVLSGVGLEMYDLLTTEEQKIYSFGFVTSTGCPNF